ncbi:MAG: adenosylcobinamide-phosphate synthase CbiB [Candidatus Omnitrophica bacterium]|nr:adenosylcobinamide-phosphate synthase CbiB [Candidatus Omnitrophota bacterium]
MTQLIFAIALAYFLDLILGDPQWFPHPVRIIGWLINNIELPLRKLVKYERLSGIIFAFLIAGSTWFITFKAVQWATSFNWLLGFFVSSLLIYTALAVKDLKVESMEVFRALKGGDLIRARKKLSMIVGRDTNDLNEQEVIRAAVETVAENTVDGIISPLFYAFLGGAPLALAYKAVSTLDSMVGYKNKKYLNFGWASAKLDDLANFIPARISALLLPAASFLTGKDGLNSWRVVLRDGGKNPSPNSGIPEAAIAGALKVQLGGLNFYKSLPSAEPLIGDNLNTLKAGHIKESIRISHISSALLLLIGITLVGLFI